MNAHYPTISISSPKGLVVDAVVLDHNNLSEIIFALEGLISCLDRDAPDNIAEDVREVFRKLRHQGPARIGPS